MEISKKEFTFPCTFKRCFWELDKCVGVKILGSVIFSCALQFPVMPQAPITAFLLKSPPAPQSIVLVINQKHCNRIIWKQSLEMWGKGGKSILDIDSWARILRSCNKRNFRRNSIRFCEQNIFVICHLSIYHLWRLVQDLPKKITVIIIVLVSLVICILGTYGA